MLSAEDGAPAGQDAAWVEALVHARVTENWEAQDTPKHLKTIRDSLQLYSDQSFQPILHFLPVCWLNPYRAKSCDTGALKGESNRKYKASLNIGAVLSTR